ncbi:Ac81-like protein [Tomelloso virus]|uniref:Ac81-like protein n=1 Tax=Tomelloso virus TaxID=2053981 RepID=A0A2H4T2Y1_9VIRU|nr:Ac81-like protein [Tomelloso virus]ATY70250.1 Ac81-like protein [Tomelloso virus]
MKMSTYKILELYCQATKKSYGLFDHYFYVIDNMEIHMGIYLKGKILPKGTTKGAHLVANYEICQSCYDKIQLDLISNDDIRLFSLYFPILNCESLCRGISVQSVVLMIAIPFILVLVIKGLFLWALVLFLLTAVLLLMYSKYMFSKTEEKKCDHIKDLIYNS